MKDVLYKVKSSEYDPITRQGVRNRKSPMDILLDSEKALGERTSIKRALVRAGAETSQCQQPQPAAASGSAQTAAPPPTSPPPQETDEFEDCGEGPSSRPVWL